MSLAGDTATEAALRIAIPLLAVGQWWLGMTADGTTEELGRTSWRWTPRRLLLAVGAIEPGARDAVSVDRDRLVARMTRIEYQRRHADPKTARRYGRRLARLSLTADDEVIAEVRRRVDRATWWQHPAELDAATQDIADQAVTALRAGLARARTWVDNRQHTATAADTTRDTAPDTGPDIGPGTGADTTEDIRPDTSADIAQDTPPDAAVDMARGSAADSGADRPRDVPRTSERTSPTAVRVARLVKRRPGIKQKDAAAALGVSLKTVQRHWPKQVNGRPVPDLTQVG
ncbi:hypothetical protein [Pilimelia terevasa]|uniref:hypothetical protein n=1 Tax=Pilimelia terevasa TaxID=53372 RepID=UPI0016689841|nr:hypothetical protein [Pilimelia terevasa]